MEFDQSHPLACPIEGLEVFLRFVRSNIECRLLRKPFCLAISLFSDAEVIELASLHRLFTLPFWHTVHGARTWSTIMECHVSHFLGPCRSSPTHWPFWFLHHIQGGSSHEE